MKQINSNYIRKQFGPAPVFLIAASIIMATTSVSLLHSGGLIPVIPGLGGALYFANEVLRDDVALTPTSPRTRNVLLTPPVFVPPSQKPIAVL